MLGDMPPEAYERGDNLVRFVIRPALMKLNGLSLGVGPVEELAN